MHITPVHMFNPAAQCVEMWFWFAENPQNRAGPWKHWAKPDIAASDDMCSLMSHWASPQWQGSPLQWGALLLGLLLLAAIGTVGVAGIHVRVSLHGELAVDIQETLWHHCQLRIPADYHLQTQTQSERPPVQKRIRDLLAVFHLLNLVCVCLGVSEPAALTFFSSSRVMLPICSLVQYLSSSAAWEFCGLCHVPPLKYILQYIRLNSWWHLYLKILSPIWVRPNVWAPVSKYPQWIPCLLIQELLYYSKWLLYSLEGQGFPNQWQKDQREQITVFLWYL